MTTVPRRSIVVLIFCSLLLVVLATLAVRRSGLLGLPAVPGGTTLESSGLANLNALAAEAAALASSSTAQGLKNGALIDRARLGLGLCAQGESAPGLAELQAALTADPTDLVIGNAYRMVVLRLIRRELEVAAAAGTLAPRLSTELEGEPVAFLEQLNIGHPSREAALQLALAWVDQMFLNPALEIKAPASVESVDILTRILDGDDPSYVPALYARGLNYLHRPARLVWPESHKAAPNAASHDLGTAVAIGRRMGVGSARLKGTLALALGDAYVKESRLGAGRSWWQIARATTADSAVRAAVDRRMSWGDRDVLDRLEADLEDRMRDLDHPMTDLSLMWEAAR